MPLYKTGGAGMGAKAKAPAARSAPKAKPTPKSAPKKAAKTDTGNPARKMSVSASPENRTIEIRQIDNGYVVRESWREKCKDCKDGPEYDYKSKETFTKTPPKIMAE
jgi:hypothetical protein